jgi:RHS repeat-associated protein
MRKCIIRFLLVLGLIMAGRLSAQTSSDLDLSTRFVGVPPTHTTVDSVARWMENPLDQKLTIAVTNLYADATNYLEITLGGQSVKFYGAGLDELNHYIPTNYPPVIVNAVLRREYPMSIVCPNSGPQGCPLFKWEDFGSPDGYIRNITNGTYSAEVSAFIWSNFTAGAQSIFTNGDPAQVDLRQTNLMVQMNRIITTQSFYTNGLFASFTNNAPIPDLMATNPTVSQIGYVNRLLLYYAVYFAWPAGIPDSSGTADITFGVKPPPELKIKKNQPAPNYTVLLNRDSSSGGVLNLMNQGTGYSSISNSIIEILKDKFGHFGLGDGCDDATKAPGQGSWLTMGPGCTQDTNRIALDWRVSLGRTFDGLAAGQLAFREPALTRDSYTPYAIYYNGSMTNLYAEMPLGTVANPFVPTNLYASVILVTTNIPSLATNSVGDVYTNYDSLLRQVKSCQTFVDILTPDTNQTVLNFYLASKVGTNQDATGLYTSFSGSPFVVWTIKNPNPATTTNLLITENRLGGGGSTNSLTKASTAGVVTWKLTQGTGPETRVETRQVSFYGSPATNRVEIDIISYAGSSTPAYQCQETYHFYLWGSELKGTSIPNSPSNLVTTYDYYTDRNEKFGDWGYGQLKQIVYPDGYWEKRVYESIDDDPSGSLYSIPGLLCYVFHPYLDGRSGGATAPGDADPLNTIFTKYSYASANGVNERNTLIYDGILGVFLNGEQEDYSCGNEGGPEGASRGSTSVSWYDDLTGYGQVRDDYSDEAPIGLAGHCWWLQNITGQQSKNSYYDHGVFDGTANGFGLDISNHLFGVGPTTYPDFRETDISVGPFGGVDSYDYNGIEDHFGTESTFLSLNPGQTKKHVSIYQGGNLVQTEEYIYLYAGGINEFNGCLENPQWLLQYKTRYYADSLGRTTNAVRIDGATGSLRTVYSADYRGGSGYDGALMLSETDETGVKTSYAYDSLQRIQAITNKCYGGRPDTTVTLTRDANGQVLHQSTVAGSLSLNEYWTFDLAGRLTGHVDKSGIAASTDYSANGQIQTVTYPGGITSITEQFLDRRKKSLTGSGVVAEYYDYDVLSSSRSYVCNDNIKRQITHFGAVNSSRWRATGQDYVGEDVWQEQPAGLGTQNTIWTRRHFLSGSLASESHSSGFPQKNYHYDLYGNLNGTQNETSGGWNGYGLSGNLDDLHYLLADNSRVSLSVTLAIQLGDNWYQATTNYTCLTNGSGGMTVSSIHLEQLNGLDTNVLSCTKDYDADNNLTVTTNYVDRGNNKITTVTSQPTTSSLNATNVYQNGQLISASTLSVSTPTLYSHDSLGRTNGIQSSLGYPASINYDPATGWVTSQTNFTGQTTSYQYYGVTETNAGKLKCQTSVTGKKTYYAYTTRGELYHTWGDVPYPAEYRYSEYGDLTNLITYRGGSGWTGSSWPSSPGTNDNTYRVYNAASGALLKKTDAQGQSVNYTYDTTTGQLLTRSWARLNGTNSVTVTNSYNGFGDLTAQEYSDGTPNVYFNSYNRAGQPRQIVDGSGTTELAYDYASRLVTSFGNGGLLNGITVSNHFNPNYGRDSVSVLNSGTTVLKDDFVYESASGRLSSVGSGACLAIYGYVPNSDLLQTTTCSSNGTTVLTTTRTWDYGMRLRSIANVVGSAPVTSHSYQYDALNRRTQATLEDGSFWKYGYDDRDELTNANRSWSYFSTTTPVSGQQFSYAYDSIGNRQTAGFGGDTNGANLRTISYTANSLNQYTNILTPGYENILGAALATNSVTVNGSAADRKAEYFHKELAVANSSGPIWQNITNVSGTFTNKGGLVFPANGQTLAYDADGNLSADGIWIYQWDAENRLISMTMTNVSGIANSNRLQLQFAYDYQGRRIQKVVYQWNGSSFGTNPVSQVRFVYDGWNLLAEVATNNAAVRSYMWGNDLSGTEDQAGGIGGLLMASISGTNCFVTYDGNGNITALINATDKSLVARYEYSPYGELLRETGLLARQNPFRFSTKFRDEESGLIYYGVRYLNPAIAKWINKDPSEEKGGINLLAFVENNPINFFDTLGEHKEDPDYGLGKEFWSWYHRSDFYQTFDGKNISPEDARYLYDEEFGKKGSIRGKFNKRGGEGGGRAGKIIGAMFLLYSVIDGVAAGNDNPIANNLAGDFRDLQRDLQSGDQAWADLDSAILAADVQNMGSDEAALWVWEAVQQ